MDEEVDEDGDEERIVEYVWLLADESPEEIQAGVLKEFGVKKSLNWIIREKQEYLGSAESPRGDGVAAASFVGDEPVQRIAEAFPSVTEKQIQKIIQLKATTRMGYRRIGQELNPPVGKDTISAILKMHQSLAKPQMPSLKSPEVTRAEENYERVKAQVAVQKYIKSLLENTREQQRELVHLHLENEGDKLLTSLAEHEMNSIYPKTYRRFRLFCEKEHLNTREALQRLDVTAEELLEAFDDWYALCVEWGDVGMQGLAVQITLEVDISLDKQTRPTPNKKANPPPKHNSSRCF